MLECLKIIQYDFLLLLLILFRMYIDRSNALSDKIVIEGGVESETTHFMQFSSVYKRCTNMYQIFFYFPRL